MLSLQLGCVVIGAGFANRVGPSRTAMGGRRCSRHDLGRRDAIRTRGTECTFHGTSTTLMTGTTRKSCSMWRRHPGLPTESKVATRSRLRRMSVAVLSFALGAAAASSYFVIWDGMLHRSP